MSTPVTLEASSVDTRQPWRDAAAGLAILAVFLLLARSLRPIVNSAAWTLRDDAGFPFRVATTTWVRAAACAALLMLVVLGWRRLAALAAWVFVAGETALALIRIRGIGDFTMPFAQRLPMQYLWPAALVAIAATLLTVSLRADRRVLPHSATLLFIGAAVVAIAEAVARPFFTPVITLLGFTGSADSTAAPLGTIGDGRWTVELALAMDVLILVFVGLGLLRVAGPVRDRMLALLIPIGAFVVVVNLGLDLAFSGAVRLTPVLGGPAYVVLVVAAALAFALVAVYPAVATASTRSSDGRP